MLYHLRYRYNTTNCLLWKAQAFKGPLRLVIWPLLTSSAHNSRIQLLKYPFNLLFVYHNHNSFAFCILSFFVDFFFRTILRFFFTLLQWPILNTRAIWPIFDTLGSLGLDLRSIGSTLGALDHGRRPFSLYIVKLFYMTD